MQNITIGMVVIAISVFGYVSNWINWRFLNYKIVHLLYYLGAFVHETSHAIFCIILGAKVSEYKVFVRDPHVRHSDSKVPFVGNLLISLAPIIGGLLFIFLINKYFLVDKYTMPAFSDLNFFINDLLLLIKQIDITKWQTVIFIFIFLNIGAMIGPSYQDLKNVWPLLIILLFIKSTFFVHLGLLAIALIVINILIQIVLTLSIFLLRNLYKFIF